MKKTDIELKLNPLQIDLIDKLIYSHDPFIAVRAGWGSGKTSALVDMVKHPSKQVISFDHRHSATLSIGLRSGN
jgi:hypothetical protein